MEDKVSESCKRCVDTVAASLVSDLLRDPTRLICALLIAGIFVSLVALVRTWEHEFDELEDKRRD